MAKQAEDQLPIAELCKLAGIEPVGDDIAPAQVLTRLIKEERFPEALRFLVNTLESGAAVRWACDCLNNLDRPAAQGARESALQVTQSWIAAPDETKRRAAKEASDNAGLETPEGVLAMAVFFSGGSVAPETAPEVPAPVRACHKLSAGAVLLAVVSDHPESASQRFQEAIQRGVQLELPGRKS
jgi:Family of unknown function (DUF6931)